MKPYSGIWPVAPTAFNPDGTLDDEGNRRVMDCMIDQNVDGVCILANYSEQFLLSDAERLSLTRLLLVFVGLAALLGLSGFVLEAAASGVARHTGLQQTTVGLLLTATATSLPELVTSVAAVRRGALTLAVGGIIGGNAFDTLFTAASDIAYREGSIYKQMDDGLLLWVSLSILMTGFLLMGLIRREQHGPGGIGFESLAVLLLYGLGIALVLGG